jgi:hypothetical protein
MAICVAAFQHWASGALQLPPVVLLLALITLGAALYPAALRVVDRNAFDLLRQRARTLVSET